ncbi:hypothetical protein M231_04949 [Tremella mesenterica]|uniref:Uncharacterized protein n=1 Tax=Tremella mesenterica TaxID=5217 RepID=A0A4Q1BJB1_TREME|nr:uncharacterized protein TREMEDRAFT_72703 [Tremella mesenterica DSM 1558]EIW72265.1 hypothetical protein TREMEDRAFT_72703 [Tremella mesenterica DSM 1558]RXK37793.1 hypothetical protein M231_04949 [Tremella mesenterica]
MSLFNITTNIPRTPVLSRNVMHHARPSRLPHLPSPHTPKLPLPTSGTSKPHINPTDSVSRTRSVPLVGTPLTLHHSPPPSAPTYTTGSVPSLLRWIGGESVRLTGQEGAPRRRERKYEGSDALDWSAEMKDKMMKMRGVGFSRKEIGQSLGIQKDQWYLISRVAPLTTEQSKNKRSEMEEQETSWGFRKRLHRAKRARRREYW